MMGRSLVEMAIRDLARNLCRADSRLVSAMACLVLTAGASLWAMSALAQLPPVPLEIHHIHGLALDRRDPEVLYVATHTGLARLSPNRGPEWVGALFDLMGPRFPTFCAR